ncbi:MAG TPA: DUF4129 domain-containing protein [Flavobacteriales bacterium]|nr:DUF4129 domain-containing protein [Flavobacteriales bacterium]
MRPALMNKRVCIAFLFCFQFMLGAHVFAQDGKLKQLDRKKWNELVGEIKKKRYDPKQQEYSSEEIEFSDENGEYSEYGEKKEYNSGTGDGGIYGSSNDDEKFFDKTNDRQPAGTNEDLSPKYDDPEKEGSSSEYSDNPDNYEPVNYNRDPVTPTTTPSSGSSAAGGGSATWLIIILIAVLVGAVVYMILVSFKDGNKKVAVPESVLEKIENMTITKSELELALEAALKDKNYREAVRIYFIAVIKEMKDHSWIRWEKKKTNYHYINEISGRPQQPDFVTATRAFEIVWYGNRSMAEGDYNQVEPLFKRLLTSIH